MPMAINKNGTANPAEKIVSRNAPCNAEEAVDAKTKIEPSIGPTHGVHPNAKAEPRIKEFIGFPRLKSAGALNCFSPIRNGIFTTLSIKSPKTITKTPPILPNHNLYGVRNVAPINPTSVPKIIKTALNPTIKKKPFRKIFQRALFAFSGSFKSSREAPLINPKYPGTKGRVQGAKKVRIPAIKAGIISEMSIVK